MSLHKLSFFYLFRAVGLPGRFKLSLLAVRAGLLLLLCQLLQIISRCHSA